MPSLQKLKKIFREQGVKGVYNKLWYTATYGKEAPRKLILKTLFPYLLHLPRLIEVETTTRCHLKCVMCEHTYWNEAGKDMTYDEFVYIIGQFPHLKWVGMTGIGTSFLNRDFLRMIEYVKSKKIDVEIYDAFHLLTKDKAKELVRLKVDKIIASIDAATAATYEKIRIGSNFEQVKQNLSDFFDIRREAGQIYPQVVFHYIISNYNLYETEKFIELLYEVTRGKERPSVFFTSILHQYKEIEGLPAVIPEEIVEATNCRALELNVLAAWNKNVPRRKADISNCTYWSMPFIFVDGTVIPCCAGNEGNRREFQRKYAMGNIFQTPFRQIWKSQKYSQFRNRVHNNVVPVQCQHCPSFHVSTYQEDCEELKLWENEIHIQ